MYQLPPVETIPKLSRDEQAELLAHLFEKEETLANILIDEVCPRPARSYKQFVEECRSALLSLLSKAEQDEDKTGKCDPRIAEIIGAHPRLGGSSKVRTTNLSEHSSAEQKSLQQGSAEEAEKLVKLNDAYEDKFPGLRFVCFVNGRPRPVIMKEMEERIQRGDVRKERAEAFNAMCDIAYDRAKKVAGKANI
ncbi:hypothetical protein DICA3_D19680 [Diutina catenulata]